MSPKIIIRASPIAEPIIQIVSRFCFCITALNSWAAGVEMVLLWVTVNFAVAVSAPHVAVRL